MWRRVAVGMVCALAFIGTAEARTFKIEAGPQAQRQLQDAARAVEEGDTISFGAGRFELSQAFEARADKLEIRGRGADRTILSFSGLNGDQPAIKIRGDRTVAKGFSIENAPADALTLSEGERIEISEIRVAWPTGAPRGANGIIVENARSVLIDRVRAQNAPAAGIATRRAREVAVRDSNLEGNRVGVMLDTTASAEIDRNELRGNGAGIFLLDTPQPDERVGGEILVTRNRIEASRPFPTERAGATAALAPQGVGVAVMAVRDVRLARNDFSGSALAHVMALAYPETIPSASFVAIPQDLALSRNSFGALGAYAPSGRFEALGAFDAQAHVLWDGADSWIAAGRPRVGVVRIGFDSPEKSNEPAPIFKSLQLGSAGAPASEAAPTRETPLILDIAAPEPRTPR